MKFSPEKKLYAFAVACFVCAAILFIAIGLLEGIPVGGHESDVFSIIFLVIVFMGCVAGTVPGYFLFKSLYQKSYQLIIYGDWLWRLLAGVYMLVLVAVAKISADQIIATATWLPAGWFPRSQEVLTGAFFISLFLASLTIPLIFVMLAWLIVLLIGLGLLTFLLYVVLKIFVPMVYLALFIFLLTILVKVARAFGLLPEPVERLIDRIASAELEPLFDRVPRSIMSGMRSIWHTFVMWRGWFLALSIYQRRKEIILSFFRLL